jgi:hypothetical protein
MADKVPSITVRMPAKRKRRSKVLWFNAVVAAAVAAEANFGLLQSVLPGNVYMAISFVLIVGNTALRFWTSQPIGARDVR